MASLGGEGVTGLGKVRLKTDNMCHEPNLVLITQGANLSMARLFSTSLTQSNFLRLAL